MKLDLFEWIVKIGCVGVFVALGWWLVFEVLPGADRGF